MTTTTKANCPDPGIYPNVPFSEYRSWEAVNNSTLRIIATKSPAHALEEILHPKEPTEALAFGQALHTMLLEPDKFDQEYIESIKVDRRTKQGKADWEDFLKMADGKNYLTGSDMIILRGIARQVETHNALNFVQGGASEVCIVWTDPKTKLLCKARLDYVHAESRVIVDVKSTRDASPEEFSRSIYHFGYYQQAAWYLRGWGILTEQDPLDLHYVILACEKEPPYAIAVYEMHEDIITAGRNAWEKALKTYAECVKTEQWPAYYTGPQIINLPKWALEKCNVGPHNLTA